MQRADDWRPSATLVQLRKRAALLQIIRQFFAERDVLEVDTPLLASAGVTDIHLENFVTEHSASKRTLFLQTSPEFAMKRLLAAGVGSIYQLGKAFRNESASSRHQPEFTLLEWYRVGMSMMDLMGEVEQLLTRVLDLKPANYVTYHQLFQRYLQVDLDAPDALVMLRRALQNYSEISDLAARETDFTTLQQLAMATVIERQLPRDCATFVYHFPIAQAALAAACSDNAMLAQRFEVYVGAMELANGYFELTDAEEQRRRFAADQAYRCAHMGAEAALDERLLQALEHGLPECSGVALGVDRLFMLVTDTSSIDAAVPFSFERI